MAGDYHWAFIEITEIVGVKFSNEFMTLYQSLPANQNVGAPNKYTPETTKI